MSGSIILVHSVKQNPQNRVGRGKGWNDSSWIWCVEVPVLSGLTHKPEQWASPCACAEIKGVRSITESPAHTVKILFTLLLERFQSQEGGPLGVMETPHRRRCLEDPEPRYVRRGWLNSPVLTLHSLPQGQECVTVTSPAHLCSPDSTSQMELVVNVCFAGGKIMTKCLGQLTPKRSAAEMGLKFRTIKVLCSALSTRQSITGLYKWSPACLKAVF